MTDTRDLLMTRLAALPEVRPKTTWGETSFFVNPDNRLKNGAYFATLKDHDGANDRASALDRPGLWRLSLGIGPDAYFERFGPRPPRPGKGGTIEGGWDFRALDTLTPHPVYGWGGWVAINCPSPATLDALAPLIATAHQRATATALKRLK